VIPPTNQYSFHVPFAAKIETEPETKLSDFIQEKFNSKKIENEKPEKKVEKIENEKPEKKNDLKATIDNKTTKIKVSTAKQDKSSKLDPAKKSEIKSLAELKSDMKTIKKSLTALSTKTAYLSTPNPSFPTSVAIVIACHTDSSFRYQVLVNNVRYLSQNNNFPIILVNSVGTEKFNYKLNHVEKTVFIPNNSVLDFGKWAHALDTFNLHVFEYVIFTNDSVIMTADINLFSTSLGKTDLLGWNDSSQCGYHYQSYFFGIRASELSFFMNLVRTEEKFIQGHEDVVKKCEIPLIHSYPSRDCFLHIADIPSHRGMNINFEHDELMQDLLFKNWLPFIKIKRLMCRNLSSPILEFLYKRVTAPLAYELYEMNF